MKRILAAVFLLLLAAVACAMGGVPVGSDDAAAVRAAAITSQYRLTSIKTTCLYFDTYDEGRSYLVRVREKHSKVCGGIPETSPTVFFLRLRKRDGDATTTAYNVDGKFQPLRLPAQGKRAPATQTHSRQGSTI